MTMTIVACLLILWKPIGLTLATRAGQLRLELCAPRAHIWWSEGGSTMRSEPGPSVRTKLGLPLCHDEQAHPTRRTERHDEEHAPHELLERLGPTPRHRVEPPFSQCGHSNISFIEHSRPHIERP
jgi:hypothetical protein